MRDSLNFFQDVDLGAVAQQIGQLISGTDFWLVGIVVSALVGLGHKMAVGHRVVYGWGLRLGALTFLIYGGYGVWSAGGFENVATLTLIGRSAVVGGSVLALVWILLPIAMFVYGNFRFGLAGFVGYVGYALLTTASLTSEAVPGIVVRGGLVAVLAMVLAWILRPIWEFAGALLRPVAAAVTPAPAAPTAKVPTEDPQKSRRSRRRRKLLATLLRRTRVEPVPPVALLPQPEQVPVSTSTQITALENESRRRRDKAKLDAELAYLLASPQMGGTFSREMFESWVHRYLGNHLPPDEVEDNSSQLQKALRQYHQRVDGPSSGFNLEELHYWFVDEQSRIQAMHLDAPAKQAKLLALQDLYVSLSQRVLGGTTIPVVQMIAPRPEKTLAISEATRTSG